MKKYIIISLSLLLCLGVAYAQDDDDEGLELSEGFAGFTPEAGDFTVALILGRSGYLSGVQVPNSPGNSTGWSVSFNSNPGVNSINEFSNATSNMVGVEVRYYLLDNIAVKLSGGALLEDTPGLTNRPAINDPNTVNAAWIPTYQAVEARNEANVNINVGAEMRQGTQFERLQLYYGVTVPLSLIHI